MSISGSLSISNLSRSSELIRSTTLLSLSAISYAWEVLTSFLSPPSIYLEYWVVTYLLLPFSWNNFFKSCFFEDFYIIKLSLQLKFFIFSNSLEANKIFLFAAYLWDYYISCFWFNSNHSSEDSNCSYLLFSFLFNYV